MSNSITEPSALIASLPFSLTRDENKEKLAETIAAELVKVIAQADCAAIFPQVDKLPEQVLDILANDLKIDWYEIDAPIKNKQQAVRECMIVHKYKGTKYAVETALRSLYNSAEVKEWFEYGGEPFHFKITVYGSSSSLLKKLYLKIQYAKNLRSVMDDVKFIVVPERNIETYYGAKLTAIQKHIGAAMELDVKGVYTIGGECFIGGKMAMMKKRIYAKLSI